MKQIINLQMSIFGSFENIEFDPSIISELITFYKNNFIPSMIQLTSLDPQSNILKNIDRLSMVSVDKKRTIVFLPDRIDCNYTFDDAETEISSLEATLEQMCDLMKDTMEYFSIVGNRIAINGSFVTDEIPLKFSDYILERPFYKKNPPSAWSVNCNTVTNLNILGSDEDVNNILNIALGTNSQDNNFAIIISFDINTVPSNSLMRFKKEAFPVFLEQALCNLNDMLVDLR